MPHVSDQMKGVFVPFDRELRPTTSRAELIARGTVVSPPSVPSVRLLPSAYQIIPRWQVAVPQVNCRYPTRSPAQFAPSTAPVSASSCSICHASPARRQRTGTLMPAFDMAVPPTTLPSPLTARAEALPPVTSGD